MMNPTAAHGLIEHGDLGLMALVLLVVVGPMVAAFVWQMKASNRQQDKARADFMSVITETGERQERTTVALTEVSVGQVRTLDRLCSRLEERPCLVGSRLGNGEGGRRAGDHVASGS